jgi:hypothetical protein
MLSVAAVVASVADCGGVVVGGFGEGAWWHRAPEPVRAAHPLGGRPLTGRARLRDLDLVRARAGNCRPWPILDDVTVEVTPAKVCLRQDVHVLSYEDGPLPVLTLPTEISSSTSETRTISMTARSELQKVGVCGGLDAKRTAVWVREYEGCIPNDGLVDEHTESLALAKPGTPVLAPGYETIRWSFVARAPGAPIGAR